MRRLARIVGIVWIAATLVGGAVLIASGAKLGNRIGVYAVFFMMVPGIGLYQWCKGPRGITQEVIQPRRGQRARIDPPNDGHVLVLSEDPLETPKHDLEKAMGAYQ
jgi:hypothetical protein